MSNFDYLFDAVCSSHFVKLVHETHKVGYFSICDFKGDIIVAYDDRKPYCKDDEYDVLRGMVANPPWCFFSSMEIL